MGKLIINLSYEITSSDAMDENRFRYKILAIVTAFPRSIKVL